MTVMDDIRAGAFGRVPDELGEPLSHEAVLELEDGTPIVVIWSGGNGPGRYTVWRDGEWRVAASPGERERDYFDLVGKSLDEHAFVGTERMHTRVWLAPPDGSENA